MVVVAILFNLFLLDLETAWILGLQCLEKNSGYSNFLSLIKIKAETEVKKTLLSNDALSGTIHILRKHF